MRFQSIRHRLSATAGSKDRMRQVPGIALVLVSALVSGMGLAAEGSLASSSGAHLLGSGSPGGQCSVVNNGSSGIDVTCTDGNNSAHANSMTGCLSISGLGICYQGTGSITVGLTGSTQLACENGGRYNVSPGAGNGSCSTNRSGSNSSTSCTNNESVQVSTASCASGCGSVSGTGCCCQVGTTGCGGGQSCTGS